MTRPPFAVSPVRTLSLALLLLAVLAVFAPFGAWSPAAFPSVALSAQADPNVVVDLNAYQDLKWRNVGPHRGGRVTAISGVRQLPCTFYMGATGGGVWKTDDCGIVWRPVSPDPTATSGKTQPHFPRAELL